MSNPLRIYCAQYLAQSARPRGRARIETKN
jgi:hypothetical protein